MEMRGKLAYEAELELEIVSEGESVAPPCAANAADDVVAGMGTTV